LIFREAPTLYDQRCNIVGNIQRREISATPASFLGEFRHSPTGGFFLSDDNSTDGTKAILSEFQKKHRSSKVEVRNGLRQRFVSNFLSRNLACDRTITGDHFAYSDQDDIWEPARLLRAIAQRRDRFQAHIATALNRHSSIWVKKIWTASSVAVPDCSVIAFPLLLAESGGVPPSESFRAPKP
jgi:glycosyltransferase involved in cell wall biosynthesis